jgi:hypothetical protein
VAHFCDFFGVFAVPILFQWIVDKPDASFHQWVFKYFLMLWLDVLTHGGKGPFDCSMKELQRSAVKAQAYGMCSHIFQVLKKKLQVKTAIFTWL